MAVIVGIDPGIAETGYAVLRVVTSDSRDFELIEAGLVRTEPRMGIEQRLLELYRGVLGIFRQHEPAAVAIEDLYTHYDHPKTAILMGHARGVVLLAAAAAGARVYHFPPARVKKALTGNGAASKRQMQLMVQNVLGLRRTPEPDHVADALSVAVCCQFTRASDSGVMSGR